MTVAFFLVHLRLSTAKDTTTSNRAMALVTAANSTRAKNRIAKNVPPFNRGKYFGKRAEYKAGSLSRLQSKGKHGRKYGYACHHRNDGVKSGHAKAAPWDILLVAKVASVCDGNAHTEAEGIEHLPRQR